MSDMMAQQPALDLTTNVFDDAAYQTRVRRAMEMMYDRLASHCGPFAKNAVVPQMDAVGNTEYVFLKDGIKIINTMRFTNDVLAENCRRMLSYLGSRIDSACHDGTTTSMMILAGLAAEEYSFAGMSPYAIEACFDTVFSVLEEALQARTITVADLCTDFKMSERDAKWFVAYHQAMISSKGDRELARAIAEVILSMPINQYGQSGISLSRVETDTRYSALYQEYDFSASAQLLNNRDRNHNMNLEYLGEDVTLFVTEDELNDGNTEHDWLVRAIHQRHTQLSVEQTPAEYPEIERIRHGAMATDFVIISPMIGPAIVQAASMYNALPGVVGKYILIQQMVNYQAAGRGDTLIMRAVQASAGVKPLRTTIIDPDAALIRHARIHQRFDQVMIGNLYQRDGELFHPCYTDPGRNPAYDKLMMELRATLDDMMKGPDAARYNDRDVATGITIYRSLICQRVANLLIGGPLVELRANYEIAKDAIGAAMSAIENGFVMGGVGLMYDALVQFLGRDQSLTEERIAGTMARVLGTILHITYGSPGMECADGHAIDFTIPDGASKYSHYGLRLGQATPSVEFVDYLTAWQTGQLADGSDSKYTLSVIGANYLNNSMSVLIQPIVGYRELIKRLRELLPKIATTVCYIDPTQGPIDR